MSHNRPTINVSHRTIVPRGKQQNKTEFSSFFHKRLKECREGSKLATTRDVAAKLGIDYELFRKKIGGQKPLTKRDLVIAICMVLRLDETFVCLNPDRTLSYINTFGRMAYSSGTNTTCGKTLVRVEYDEHISR